MIRIELPDTTTADRLIEALYIAAGRHPCTARSSEWRRIAAELETAVDQLPAERTAAADARRAAHNRDHEAAA